MQVSGISGAIPNMDPTAYAKIYAQQNNISVQEAKTELQEMYGDPKPPQENSNVSSGNMNVDETNETTQLADAFAGQDQLAELNKFFLLKKSVA